MRRVQLAGCRSNVGGMEAECGGGSCPAVFLFEDGRLVVQGTKLAAETRGELTLPNHEDAVEIPIQLLEEAFANLKKGRP